MKLSACKCGGEAKETLRAPQPCRRYRCTACPASTAWYHTQAEAAAAWERMQGTGEPVAWQWRVRVEETGAWTSWVCWESKPVPGVNLVEDFMGEIRPLYSALSSRPADGAQERIAELETALKPFADIAPCVEYTPHRDGDVVHRQDVKENGKHVGYKELRKNDFRRAAAALSAASAGKGE